MKFPILGGIVFLLGGVGAIAAVAFANRSPADGSAVVQDASAQKAGQVVFSVPDMHCEFACAPKVRETLAAIPGVEKVETNVENQTATVIPGDGFDEGKVLAALDKAGYPGKKVAN